MTQDELKAMVGQAAIRYVQPGQVVGVGTGSTVNHFIDALAAMPQRIRAAVSSSVASTERLRQHGIEVWDANAVESLSVYVDGADEIDGSGCMIKGGGAALTREKIVAELAREFVCIVDASKCVSVLGGFALPVEVIPMASARVARQFHAMGGHATVRTVAGVPVVTDNGGHIVDVTGLSIHQPVAFEQQVNQWPGVVTVGVFARNRAQVALVGTPEGVRTQRFTG